VLGLLKRYGQKNMQSRTISTKGELRHMAILHPKTIDAAIEKTKVAIERSSDFSIRQNTAEQTVNAFLQSVAEKIQELVDRQS
jgi:hypothetical protein